MQIEIEITPEPYNRAESARLFHEVARAAERGIAFGDGSGTGTLQQQGRESDEDGTKYIYKWGILT